MYAILFGFTRSPYLVISVTRFWREDILREPGMNEQVIITLLSILVNVGCSPVTAYCTVKIAVLNAIDMW